MLFHKIIVGYVRGTVKQDYCIRVIYMLKIESSLNFPIVTASFDTLFEFLGTKQPGERHSLYIFP